MTRPLGYPLTMKMKISMMEKRMFILILQLCSIKSTRCHIFNLH